MKIKNIWYYLLDQLDLVKREIRRFSIKFLFNTIRHRGSKHLAAADLPYPIDIGKKRKGVFLGSDVFNTGFEIEGFQPYVPHSFTLKLEEKKLFGFRESENVLSTFHYIITEEELEDYEHEPSLSSSGISMGIKRDGRMYTFWIDIDKNKTSEIFMDGVLNISLEAENIFGGNDSGYLFPGLNKRTLFELTLIDQSASARIVRREASDLRLNRWRFGLSGIGYIVKVLAVLLTLSIAAAQKPIIVKTMPWLDYITFF